MCLVLKISLSVFLASVLVLIDLWVSLSFLIGLTIMEEWWCNAWLWGSSFECMLVGVCGYMSLVSCGEWDG